LSYNSANEDLQKSIFNLPLCIIYANCSLCRRKINDFAVEMNIQRSGKVEVKETIQYDFGDDAHHGIYRTVPFIKTNMQGKRFRLDFSDIKVTDENNKPYTC